MRKLTKKSLDELAKVMPVISEREQSVFVGGGTGTKDNPYTYQEFLMLSSSGSWNGGYVENVGYLEAGKYVNKGDVNGDIAENWNPITGVLMEIFNIKDITQPPIEAFDYWQYERVKNYLSTNDSIYKVTTTYISNIGRKVEKDIYYDKNKNIVAEIVRR